LSSTYNELVTVTNDPESLEETQRKQNISESLCNINDDAFNFFIQIEKYSRDLMTYENLQMKKSDFFIYVKTSMLENNEHKKAFLKLFFHDDNRFVEEFYLTDCKSCFILRSIFNDLISLFVKVSVSQFRKKMTLHL
jgi:hypothetical protein